VFYYQFMILVDNKANNLVDAMHTSFSLVDPEK